jgi:hypothetical protein
LVYKKIIIFWRKFVKFAENNDQNIESLLNIFIDKYLTDNVN